MYKKRLRQSEIEALSASTEFSEFYERLRVIKDHHRKYPNEPVEPPEMEFIHMNQLHGNVEDGEEDGRFFFISFPRSLSPHICYKKELREKNNLWIYV